MSDQTCTAVFYDDNDREIGRKTYSSYGRMIHNGMLRAKKIGAAYFWHVHFLRKFNTLNLDD